MTRIVAKVPAASPEPKAKNQRGMTPGLEDPSHISAELQALTDLDTNTLRVKWRKVFGRSAPAHLPRYLLVRMIAYRIQAKIFGDLDRETIRFLSRVTQEIQPAGEGRGRKRLAVPVVQLAAPSSPEPYWCASTAARSTV